MYYISWPGFMTGGAHFDTWTLSYLSALIWYWLRPVDSTHTTSTLACFSDIRSFCSIFIKIRNVIGIEPQHLRQPIWFDFCSSNHKGVGLSNSYRSPISSNVVPYTQLFWKCSQSHNATLHINSHSTDTISPQLCAYSGRKSPRLGLMRGCSCAKKVIATHSKPRSQCLDFVATSQTEAPGTR